MAGSCWAARRATAFRIEDLRQLAQAPLNDLAMQWTPRLQQELQLRTAQQSQRLGQVLGAGATSQRMMESSFTALGEVDGMLQKLSRGEGDVGGHIPERLRFEAVVRSLYGVDNQRASFVEIYTEELGGRSLAAEHEPLLHDIMASHLGTTLLLQHFLAVVKAHGFDRRGFQQGASGEEKARGGAGMGLFENGSQLEAAVQGAVQQATALCETALDVSPPVVVTVEDSFRSGEEKADVWYPGPFLYHGLLELLKNALGATLGTEDASRAVHVGLRTHDSEMHLTVADEAQGLEEKALEAVQRWSRDRSHTKRYDRLDEQMSYASPQRPPLAGLGFGLPFGVAMLSHFGGRVSFASALGKGTTVEVILPRGTHHAERIPTSGVDNGADNA